MTDARAHEAERFRREFVRALRAPAGASVAGSDRPDGHENLRALAAQPAFAVYRNTVMKGCIDALQANFPTVARLVGDAWFRAAAAEFVALHLPDDPCLLYYGHGFPGWLSDFAPAAGLPYLPQVARLDRLRTECHAAADAPPLSPQALAATGVELAGCILLPHPAARWLWFDDVPAWTIWRANNEAGIDVASIAWRSEGGLFARPHDAVRWIALGRAGMAFLDCSAGGGTLAAAAAAAQAADPQADLAALLAALLEVGAFTDFSPPSA